MRTIFLLLLLANLVLLAYTRFDSGGTGEAVRLTEQVRPEMIKVLTPQQVAALGPAKVAALADVCVEWGPFSDADRARAMSELEPLALGRLLSQKKVEAASSGPGPKASPQTVLVVRAPEASVVAKLKALKAQYADTDIKIGTCDKP